MPDIDDMLNDILRREGGFVNDPYDHGGPTNKGVTQAILSDFLGRQATVEDIHDLSEEMAKDIYRQRYFTDPHIDKLPESIQPVMFDTCVNWGARRSINWLQDVLNDKGYGPLSDDGALGRGIIAAAQRAAVELDDLNRALIERRRRFLQDIIAKFPAQAEFQRGLVRLDEIEQMVA